MLRAGAWQNASPRSAGIVKKSEGPLWFGDVRQGKEGKIPPKESTF